MTVEFLAGPGGRLSGRLRVPGDKSISHRAIMLAAIAEGDTHISGFLEGDDALATMRIFRALGVRIDGPAGGEVTVHGVGLHGLSAPQSALDCGNSGTTMRLLAGLLAPQAFDSELTGDESLQRRPMRRVADPLGEMGARIDTRDGHPPIRIRGGSPLSGIRYEMPVASAQVKSSLILAGLYARGETRISEPAPTRDHTERMLASFGCPLRREGSTVVVSPARALRGTRIPVPADISSAAFFMVGASIAPGSDLLLADVGVNPTRAGAIEILRLMGADITLENPRDFGGEPVADVRVRHAPLQGIVIPRSLVPSAIDEFPVLFIAAANASGETVLTGAEELRVKESDRIQVMAEGLARLGIRADPLPDGIRIIGAGAGAGSAAAYRGATVDSRGDHRIAMAFAIASIRSAESVRITDSANVATSFPGFVGLAQAAGLPIHASVASEPIPPVIAIDGPSASGKGTVAQAVAEALGFHYLDSGALYRLVALAALQRGVGLDDAAALASLARALSISFDHELIIVDNHDVTLDIRSEEVSVAASRIAAHAALRSALIERQHAFREAPGLVAEGRDMGSVVFPDARLKVFLTAGVEARARRRHKQLNEKGIAATLPGLLKDLRERDARDSTRSAAPLKQCPDARRLDTSDLSAEQATRQVLAWYHGQTDGK